MVVFAGRSSLLASMAASSLSHFWHTVMRQHPRWSSPPLHQSCRYIQNKLETLDRASYVYRNSANLSRISQSRLLLQELSVQMYTFSIVASQLKTCFLQVCMNTHPEQLIQFLMGSTAQQASTSASGMLKAFLNATQHSHSPSF